MRSKQMKKVWLDGRYINWDMARVHILTHALHYGSSVFEGVRFYATDQGSKIFRLDDHIRRFFYSAKALGLAIPHTQKTLCAVSKKIVAMGGMKEGYLRPIAFFGEGGLSINPVGFSTSTAIFSCPWPARKETISVCTAPYMRIHPKSTVVHAKIGGHYVNSILAFNYARKKCFDEVIFLDDQGVVAEGAAANIFMIKNGIISTPTDRSILPGITRQSLIEIARRDFGKKVLERVITMKELKSADEVFFAGTAYEVTPVLKIDGIRVGSGKVGHFSVEFKKRYQDIVHGRVPRYKKWLD